MDIKDDSKGITFVSTPHEREKGKQILDAPVRLDLFYEIVNNADWAELKKYGFRKWDTINTIVEENISIKNRYKSRVISIPTYSMDEGVDAIKDLVEGNTPNNTSGSMLIDLAPKHEEPTELLSQDMDIVLFPGEWYNVIPDGFHIVGLSGEKYTFEKGKSDDDIRFGCLPYGILRPISNTKK